MMPSELLIPFYLSYAAVWILLILQSVILLGVVRMVYQLQQNSTMATASEGQPVPEFSAIDLSSTAISHTTFAGRVRALLFFSADCSACKETLADLSYLRYKANGNLIAICRASRNECVEIAKQYKLELPVVVDSELQISRLFGVSSVPTVVIINEQNRIQSVGQPEREKIQEPLEQVPNPVAQGVG